MGMVARSWSVANWQAANEVAWFQIFTQRGERFELTPNRLNIPMVCERYELVYQHIATADIDRDATRLGFCGIR